MKRNFFEGAAAVVTGAGSGLGRELCLELARRKARVWAVDLEAEAARRTADEAFRAGAAEARASVCDVRRAEAFEALGSEVLRLWGAPDLVVNNAGVAVGGPFERHTLEDWQRALDTNLWGVVHGCRIFYPAMRARSRGAILNIASAAGLLNPPNMAAYNVAKAGVISLSESLRAETSTGGIRIAVACPTFFQSGLFEKGSFTDGKTRETARRLFAHPSGTARGVALSCLRAVERGRFYVLPMWDGRALWGLKRLSPRSLIQVWRMVERGTAHSRSASKASPSESVPGVRSRARRREQKTSAAPDGA